MIQPDAPDRRAFAAASVWDGTGLCGKASAAVERQAMLEVTR
jgi:hypothetical protein